MCHIPQIMNIFSCHYILFCNKEIQPVHSKGDQSWVFFGRTDVEAETAILWPPDVKSWLIGKDPDAGKDWGQEEKGTTEDKMVAWHHWLNGNGFGWTLGVDDGQGGLAYWGSWGRKESDMTERLNWTELKDVIGPKTFLSRSIRACVLPQSVSTRDTQFASYITVILLNAHLDNMQQ